MGRAGITYVPRRHVAAAHEADPLVVPPTTHPHAPRHSRAAHLVEADADITYVRDLMGHSPARTTEIYAKISSKSRQKAVEKAAANLIMGSAYGEEDRSAIMEWLRNLPWAVTLCEVGGSVGPARAGPPARTSHNVRLSI